MNKPFDPPLFLKTRYRALPGKKDAGDHWQGGPALHPEAVCPNCSEPYLLLWDINCFDKRWKAESFGPWERLPLYFCWTCVDDVVYTLDKQGKFVLLSSSSGRERGYQYKPYPKQYKRMPLALDSVWPGDVKKIVNKMVNANDITGENLTEAQHARLDEFFGHSVRMTLFLHCHQFGGMPLHRSWSEEPVECPNPECRVNPLSKLFFGKKKRVMCFLAGILNDPWHGLPMVEKATKETKESFNTWEATVQFHICPGCFTIHGCNRCT